MAGRLPAGVIPGQIYRHDCFYRDSAGQWQVKYLLVLTGTPDGDVVFRLLTSRAHGRPEQPPCYHGNPYPSFYLGYLGGALTAKSWLDLRRYDDYDGISFAANLTARDLSLVAILPQEILCQALDCVANADDTTRQHEVDPMSRQFLAEFKVVPPPELVTGSNSCRHTPRLVFGSPGPDGAAGGCRIQSSGATPDRPHPSSHTPWVDLFILHRSP